MGNYVGASAKCIIISAIFDVITQATGGATSGHALVTDATGRAGIYGYVDTGVKKVFAANFDGTVDQAGVAVTEGTAYVIQLRHDGSTIKVSINGGAEVSVASGATSGALGALRFGSRGSALFDGKLFEAAIFSDSTARPSVVADFMAHCGAV